MTDLQIKYWQAQETARANQAQEALKGRQVAIDESKVEYEIDEMLARIAKLKEEAKLISTQQSESFGKNMANFTKAFESAMKGWGAIL